MASVVLIGFFPVALVADAAVPALMALAALIGFTVGFLIRRGAPPAPVAVLPAPPKEAVPAVKEKETAPAVLAPAHPVLSVEHELRMVAKSARCLLWYAVVHEDENHHLQWQIRVFDGAHNEFMPIETLEKDSWAQAWYYRRHPEDIPRLDELAWHAIKGGKPGYRQEFRCFRTEQDMVWIDEDVRIEQHTPNDWHLFGVCTEITERKQIEAELKYALAGARCLLWSSVVYDYGGFLTWNVKIANLESAQNFIELKLKEGQAWDQAWYESKFQEDLKAMDGMADRALREGKRGYEQEYRCTRVDGDIRWVYEIVRIEQIKPNVWHLVGICADITDRKRAEEEREKLITELKQALAEVKTLSGLLPICASCKRVRDDGGYWNQIETYIHSRAPVQFSHGLCPECITKLYPDLDGPLDET